MDLSHISHIYIYVSATFSRNKHIVMRALRPNISNFHLDAILVKLHLPLMCDIRAFVSWMCIQVTKWATSHLYVYTYIYIYDMEHPTYIYIYIIIYWYNIYIYVYTYTYYGFNIGLLHIITHFTPSLPTSSGHRRRSSRKRSHEKPSSTNPAPRCEPSMFRNGAIIWGNCIIYVQCRCMWLYQITVLIVYIYI